MSMVVALVAFWFTVVYTSKTAFAGRNLSQASSSWRLVSVASSLFSTALHGAHLASSSAFPAKKLTPGDGLVSGK